MGATIRASVETGVIKTVGCVTDLLQLQGCRIGYRAEWLMRNRVWRFPESKKTVEVAWVSVGDLGFTSAAKQTTVLQSIGESQLAYCRKEIALLVATIAQSLLVEPGLVLFGMQPLVGEDGRLEVLSLRRADELWLETESGHPDYCLSPDHELIFEVQEPGSTEPIRY